METNKYYTPGINEFNTGFEYEAYIPEKELWGKEVFHLNQSHINLVKYVDIQDENTLRRIRVKYLDSEDIESLGFKFIKVGWSTTSKIFRCNRDRGYELYLREASTVHISTSSGLTMFEGIVKNKSVLKQVLKMIGVIE